jgi:hypothetical protein
MEKLKAYLIALRNLIVGSNLFSLAFIFIQAEGTGGNCVDAAVLPKDARRKTET